MPKDQWRSANQRARYGPKGAAPREALTVVGGTTCPICLSPMVLRQNRTTGEPFMGCTAYPQCRGTRRVEEAARGAAGSAKKGKGRKRKGRRHRKGLAGGARPPEVGTPVAANGEAAF